MPDLKSALSARRLWNAWPFWLKVLVAASILFLIAALGTRWTGDRKDFPAWLAAVATAFALIAAMFAARYAANAYVMEVKRDDRRADQERRTQAEAVAAWYQSQFQPIMVGGKAMGPQSRVYGVMVRNASNVPVTQLVIDITLRSWPSGPLDESLGSQQIGLVPPGVDPTFVPFEREIADRIRISRQTADGEPVDFEVHVDLRFRDSAGRSWVRSSEGELRERDAGSPGLGAH